MRYFLIFALFSFSLQAQHHFIPGLKVKVKPIISGKVLLGELNCTSCHESSSKDILHKQAPILEHTASRIKSSYIIDLLISPQKTKSGTTMPDVLHKLSADKKKEVATAIAAYLTEDQKNEHYELLPKGIAHGKELFHSTGCVACHSPRDNDGQETLENSVPLQNLSDKYLFTGLQKFLFEPHKVRPSGRMPDMKLSQEDAKSITSYLMSKKSALKSALKTANSTALIKAGKAYFSEYNCSACHKLSDHKPKMSLKLESLNDAHCKGPAYSLTNTQEANIKTALKSTESLSNTDQITQYLTALNCYACHERDDLGGVAQERNEFFTTHEVELGDAGRIPPPLTNIGAKLQKSWMHKVLVNGESLRKYMNTRMPQFGEKNVKNLIALFDKVDKVPASGLTDVTSKKDRKPYRMAGWKLVGIEGNNCISCHNYNGHASLGLKAMDIVSTSKRLKRDWFYHYMLNPAKHRPGTIMPSFWPNGKALQTEVLNGDTKEQLRAMWLYFTIGQTQQTPKGLNIPPVILKADQQPQIYRGRGTAGFRGIAIGFPEGLNMSFDAEAMNFTALWKGEFVKFNWRGQAPGNFSPASKSVPINSGIPFAQIKEDEKWPTRKKISGKVKLNTEPLFVRQRGYRFKGYYFDKKKQPVLMYNFGDVSIEDMLSVKGKQTLRRTILFKTEKPQSFFYRVASNADIKVQKEQSYIINKEFELIIESPFKSYIRKLNQSELLIEVKLKPGETRLMIDYRFIK
jgi:mono/diheme cytochrome c family protein